MPLKDALRYFDFAQQNPILMVYVASSYQPKADLKRIEANLLNAHNAFIGQHFAFVGVLDTSPEISQLEKFGIKVEKNSLLLFFAYDLFDELSLLKRVELDEALAKAGPETLPPILQAVVNEQTTLKLKEDEYLGSLNQKYEPGNARPNQPGQAHGLSPDYLQDEYDAFDQDPYAGQQAGQSNVHPELKKQFSAERRMKNEQNAAYQQIIKQHQETLSKKKEVDEQKKQEEIKKRSFDLQKEEIRKYFENEKLEGRETTAIGFRLPSGQRVEKTFSRDAPLSIVKNYVLLLDKKGFENEESDFELAAGYPMKTLDLAQTLRQAFGESDSELVHVKEVHA